jgi:transcription elongation GreA/GreB family factor
MNKQILLETLLGELKANLESLVNAAFIAKEAATSEESKAENKYDTRGLEASYLAGAQAKRAEDLKESIYKLQKLNLRDYAASDAIGVTAVVNVRIDDAVEKSFFILPSAGGQKIVQGTTTYHVITPESPVGSVLVGKKLHDVFQMRMNQKSFEYELVDLF